MEKIINIGDIHGRGFWETIKKYKTDRFIFIGDYFDSYYIDFYTQMDNFKEIVKFKKKNPEKVVLLLGNHDYHYIDDNEMYSGYQEYHAMSIKGIIMDNLELFKVAHIEEFNGERILYSHAGVTQTWCKNNSIDCVSSNLDEEINSLFKKDNTILRFTGRNIYGDSPQSSPIWVRPKSLMLDGVEGYTQVVGHTTQDKFKVETNKKGNKFIFIDLPDFYVSLDNEGFESKEFYKR